MQDDFAVAGCEVVKNELLANFFAVVDLAIVDEVQMRQGFDSHWLHAVEIIENGETVEGEAAVFEVRNRLHAKHVGSSLADFPSTFCTF